MFSGAFQGPCIFGEVLLGVNIQNPTSFYVYGKLSEVTMGKIFRMLGSKLTLPKPLQDTGFPKGVEVRTKRMKNELKRNTTTSITSHARPQHTLFYHTTPYSTVPYRYHATRHHTIPQHSIAHHSTRHETTTYYTISCLAVRYRTIVRSDIPNNFEAIKEGSTFVLCPDFMCLVKTKCAIWRRH